MAEQETELHVCETCNDIFNSKILLDKHLLTCADTKPFLCETCCQMFATKKDLLHHEQTCCQGNGAEPAGLVSELKDLTGTEDSDENRPHECQCCFLVFESERELTDHKKVCGQRRQNTEKQFVCPLCKETFSHQVTFIPHLRSHRISPTTAETCLVCDKPCEQAYLRRHLASHINEQGSVLSFNRSSVLFESKLHRELLSCGIDTVYQCAMCGRLCTEGTSLISHMQSHSCERFQCDHCGEACNTKSKLILHVVEQHGENNLVCDKKELVQAYTAKCGICQKKFHSENDVLFHMRIHVVEVTLAPICPVYEEQLQSEAEFISHIMRHTHAHQTGNMVVKIEEQFICPLCDETFFADGNDKRKFITHVRKHIKGEPRHDGRETCLMCGESFAEKIQLTQHLAVHVNENKNLGNFDERPLIFQFKLHRGLMWCGIDTLYQCVNCENLCTEITGLNTHMLKHCSERFQCEQCGKAFTAKQSLTKHVAKQHGKSNRPVSMEKEVVHAYTATCDICQQEFMTTQGAVSHMKTHHVVEIPLSQSCPLCDGQFKSESDLASHISTHTSSSCTNVDTQPASKNENTDGENVDLGTTDADMTSGYPTDTISDDETRDAEVTLTASEDETTATDSRNADTTVAVSEDENNTLNETENVDMTDTGSEDEGNRLNDTRDVDMTLAASEGENRLNDARGVDVPLAASEDRSDNKPQIVVIQPVKNESFRNITEGGNATAEEAMEANGSLSQSSDLNSDEDLKKSNYELSPQKSLMLVKNQLMCSCCGVEFKDEANIIQHRMLCHPNKNSTVLNAEHGATNVEESSIDVLNLQHVINIEPRHDVIDVGDAAEIKRRTRTDVSLRHILQQGTYLCSQCSASFKTLPELMAHLRSHGNDRAFTIRFHLNKKQETQGGNSKLRPLLPKVTPRLLPKVAPKRFKNIVAHTSESQAYVCNRCFVAFDSIELLAEHRMSCLPLDNEPIKCQKCNTTFDNDGQLNTHYVTQHSEMLKNVIRHNKPPKKPEVPGKPEVPKRSGSTRVCDICECGLKCPSESVYMEHRATCEEKAHTCPVCGKAVKEENKLIEHMTNKHRRAFNSTRVFKSQNVDHRYVVQPRVYISKPCVGTDVQIDKETYSLEDMLCKETSADQHGQGEETVDYIAKHNVQEKDESIAKRIEVKPFVCDICECGFLFPSDSMFMEHLATCRKNAHVCPVCGKAFKEENKLEEHVAKKHSTNDLIVPNKSEDAVKVSEDGSKTATAKCEDCGKTFLDSHRLKRHVQGVHGEATRFTCEVCGRIFGSYSNYVVHVVTHSGLKPFLCDICEESFPDKPALNDHLLTHISDKEELKKHISKHKRGKRQFTCSMCNSFFFDQHNFVLHVESHSKERNFKCNQCGQAFGGKYQLAKHVIEHSKHVTAYAQRSRELSRNLTCSFCDKLFPTKHSYYKHMEIHQTEGQRRFKCTQCGRTYEQKSNLVKHMKSHARDVRPKDVFGIFGDTLSKTNESNDPAKKRNSNLLPQLSIRIDKEWNDKTEQDAEKRRVTEPNLAEDESKVTVKPNVETGSGNQSEPELQSGSGNKSGPALQTGGGNQGKLELQTESGNQSEPEMQTGSGNQSEPELQTRSGNQGKPELQKGSVNRSELDLQTGSGNQSEPDKIDLNSRMEVNHREGTLIEGDDNEEERKAEPSKPKLEQKVDTIAGIRIGLPVTNKSFRCRVCHRIFNSLESLKRHKHRPIRKPPPHDCEVCGRTCCSFSALNVHKMIHTGEKPFQCDKCGKSFIQKSAMLSHVRVHTGERPFKCDQCGKAFSQQMSLRLHLLTHDKEARKKKLQCKECGKTSCTPQALKQHMVMHTGEKPYQCKVCWKRFTAPSSVYVHMRLHTGVRPYKCQYCDKQYTHKSNLTVHIRTKHRK